MKLTILGKEHDVNKEIELMAFEVNKEREVRHGFTVTMKYNDNDKYLKGRTFVKHNVTEVHHLYKPGMIAIESDIHCSGGASHMSDLESVTVVVATKPADEFFEEITKG